MLSHLVQVVSTVATLSKTTTTLSKDAKNKMVSVGRAGLASAKLSPKPITPDSASRLIAVLAAGSGVSAVCKLPTGCKRSTAVPTSRHLLEVEVCDRAVASCAAELLGIAALVPV